MPVNGFTVGKDVSLDIVGPNGPLRFNQIVGFSSKQDISDKGIKGLDGITRHVRFPNGWSGSFSLQRQDSTVDDYFAQLEANYYAGVNERPVSITETIQEASGQVTQYRYMDVLLKLDNAGDFKGDDSVNQSISFVASRRIKVA